MFRNYHRNCEEYLELFQEHGGEEIQLVPSLNDNDDWAEGLYEIIKKKLEKINILFNEYHHWKTITLVFR